MMNLSRRSFLAAAAAAVGGKLIGCSSAPVKVADGAFRLGVASGDPSADGVVLWTRLAPHPLETGGGVAPVPVDVTWRIAEDEQFTKGLREGVARALPELAHSVHVEVAGLSPGRSYFYQFRVGDEPSPVGRTRTLPAPGDPAARLKFGLASCQHVEYGYFTAYQHLLRDDVDLVIHVGDYIYEGAALEKRPRRHVGKECYSLDEYRIRYGQYKEDADLRAMHAAVPWILTPDDHEVDNNYANDISEEKDVTPAQLLKRRAGAYQAYYEHQPLRIASLPKGPDALFYRRLSWGRLADFFVLDTRQYRTDQPCGDGNKPPCDQVMDPNATILGQAQRDWLFEGLARSSAGWNVLAQQVMFARVDRKPGDGVLYSMDQWPGYEVERRRVLRYLADKKVANPVVLSGDIHTNWANELTPDFDKPDAAPVATEFVGTSISSGGDGPQAPKDLDQLLADNPMVKFHNTERGYLTCTVDAKEWRTDYRTVPYVTRPGAPVNTRASMVVESGRAGLKKA